MCELGYDCSVVNSDQQMPQSETTRVSEGVAEEEEPDGSLTVEDVLTQLSLENLIGTFQKEQIDLDSLVRWLV